MQVEPYAENLIEKMGVLKESCVDADKRKIVLFIKSIKKGLRQSERQDNYERLSTKVGQFKVFINTDKDMTRKAEKALVFDALSSLYGEVHIYNFKFLVISKFVIQNNLDFQNLYVRLTARKNLEGRQKLLKACLRMTIKDVNICVKSQI